nr:MAG TPA: hypothetical protein [Caudoviricetes sp.]
MLSCYCFTWNNLLLMFHVKRFVKKIKIFNLRTINKNNLVVS